MQLNTAPRQAETPANRVALLFDDGRLISTVSAGAASWQLAFDELYGIPAEIGKVHRSRDDGSEVGPRTFIGVIGHLTRLRGRSSRG